MNEPSPQGTPFERNRALAIHIFTATGTVWGFMALLAAARQDWRAMFLWLAAALFVDGVDGSLARRYDVKRFAPRFSGEAIDCLVDYFTYAIVPVFALMQTDYLAPGWNAAAAAMILLTSAFYMADQEMKTEDGWFQGFPMVWNLVVFYVFLLDPPSWATFVVVAFLSVFTFSRYMFVHLFRVKMLRGLTLSLMGVWSVLALYAIWENMDPAPWVVWILCVIGVYFLGLGYFRVKPKGAAR
ncbi:CDP-alcohol phosphatidyltransferase family protein [Neomegalonema sp.]|uniref:CDP-alcohol phosphatidyltransferase family protein n=1 Tax=Neomegalonema sp. TaxID=2039713 RepID=UPI0026035314|nr:CDP-alcohol phosphatidyltransferase family protein [Neomegalonema sp.]MDD2868826.1 phosphatidylcholine synthase [Neomegalonema sp.]